MSERLEFWAWINGPAPARRAARAESQGWTGVGVGDSQSLQLDCYVALALAAGATTHLRLATAVSNPLTRLPAVTAGAIASLQVESGGRAVLGIGRGDAALTHLGLSPAPVNLLRDYLERVQGLLRGEEVSFDRDRDSRGLVRSLEELAVAGQPAGARLRWLPTDLPKVPVDVAASGPRTIAVGATLAERVTFAVGVARPRVEWAVECARSAQRAAGRADHDVELGAYVPVLVHPDRDVAREVVAGMAASVARFSVLHGTTSGPLSETERETLADVGTNYDLAGHFALGARHAQRMVGDAVDSWAIAGPPDHCIERLRDLAACGLQRVFVLDAGFGVDVGISRESRRLFTTEVMPGVNS